MAQTQPLRENLHENLHLLVTDFGYDNVRKALAGMRTSAPRVANSGVAAGNARAATGKSRSRPCAIRTVQKLAVDDPAKHAALMKLAEKYEAKTFMPTAIHARSFLHPDRDPHRNSGGIRSRRQVTVRVFKKLAAMETVRVQEFLDRGLYGPPKRLEPYARAIENFGRARREEARQA